MGKRRVPVSAAPAREPWEPTCLACRSEDVTTGAFLERPMVECAFCAACVARLTREAARGRTAKVDWRLLPRCSRCGAQVPGMARIPWDHFDESVDEFDTVYLCHQCCVTIHRQALLAQEEWGADVSAPPSCSQCGEDLVRFDNGRVGCVACNTWAAEDG